MLDTTDELNNLTSWLQILEKIVAQSANMVVITDAEQRIRWVNQTYTRVTGWALEEVQGKRAGELVRGPLTDRLLGQRLSARLRQGESVSGVEMLNYRRDGEPYTVSLNIEPIRDEQGQVLAFFSIQSDVSEKRALESSNAQLQHHLQVAQRLARLGRVQFDPDKGTMQWSSEVYSILELPRDDTPKTFSALLRFVSPEAQQDLQKWLLQVMQTGAEFDHELPITTHHGRRRWVRCRGVPERSGNSIRPPGTWTIQDVTVYKELIEQKRLTNAKLQTMVDERTLNLEEANHSLEAFSHALSHDLKKPIRHMVSYAEIVQESLATDDIASAKTYCRKIVAAGTRLRSLIDGMLEFSRVGRRAISPAWVAMDDLVNDCLAEVAASFEHRRFCAAGQETLPEVWADPVLLREVWTNLIDNAFKYSNQATLTKLTFACNNSDSGWTLSLRDNGCGFSPSMQSQIFQMFGRANSDEAIVGDGIGLALCQRIVQAHGGRIWAESAMGEGSAFLVFLPRCSPGASVGPL
ncbi:MAG: PAS domain S-box protein [Hydrogenophaga sp.]|uniref:sensor histidine kinase n=1 Tax=Hydrogenophaga sp. TaxID=1904254 RepID=UPI00272FA9BF|nr:ATP-binding protein [Hydrogenophaga sp.]MDP2407893.1 PAS domain S-box protein [Hydrogenophaga sp.]MDZ4174901.1 PAS domain S-box protein [Hydrogenophaga sp.]